MIYMRIRARMSCFSRDSVGYGVTPCAMACGRHGAKASVPSAPGAPVGNQNSSFGDSTSYSVPVGMRDTLLNFVYFLSVHAYQNI